MRTNLTYIPSLTGVRAITAYLVFFFHFNPLPVGSWGWRLANEGHIGVTIFFVLSGFLIPLRYADKVKFSRHWLRQYFQNRFSRIYPLYALLTIITFVAIWRDPTIDPAGLSYNALDMVVVPLLNLTFLRGFFDRFKFTGVSQGWTLTVEECFYAFAPLLLFVLVKLKTGVKYVMLLASAIGLGVLGCLFVKLMPNNFGFFDSYQFMFYRTFFGRGLEFMIGAALALFIREHYRMRTGMWATGLGALWIIGSMWLLSTMSSEEIPTWKNSVGIAINNLWLPVGIVLLLYGLITERSWLCKVLETPVAQVLGKSSYAFYLIHMGVFSIFIERNITANYYIIFTLSLLMAIVLWKWIEEPLNNKLRAIGNAKYAN